MNREIAKRWVAALRSKKFHQATGALRKENDHDSFCCLGVLCELARPDGIVERREGSAPGYMDRAGNIASGTLPDEVLVWAGMKDKEGTLPDGRTLAAINDAGGNFDHIAIIIEQYVDAL